MGEEDEEDVREAREEREGSLFAKRVKEFALSEGEEEEGPLRPGKG